MGRPLKFALLLKQLPGFLSVCLEELAGLPDTEVSVLSAVPQGDAPYHLDEVSPAGVVVHYFPSLSNRQMMLREVSKFEPDILIVTGWERTTFRYVARRVPATTLRVLLMDNQWLATPKQMLGVMTSSVYVQPLFDVAFLPGERQAVFARKLHFSSDDIWPGAYTCDHQRFSRAATDLSARAPDAGQSFLFVGRMVQEKGLVSLAEAYRDYRTRSHRPWPLVLCGTGPLSKLFAGMEGVTLKGFVQPSALPAIFATSGCLVMPSLFEPWGVAIHEATAAGLTVICSNTCGAAPHLVEDGVNGYVVTPGSVSAITDAMLRCSELGPAERADMAVTSRGLSERYTPSRWASILRRRAKDAVTRLRAPAVP